MTVEEVIEEVRMTVSCDLDVVSSLPAAWLEICRLARLGAAVEAIYSEYAWNDDDDKAFALKITKAINQANLSKEPA